MRHKRELLWWAGACAAAVALSTLLGGFIGPIVTLFALVLLAGAVLIEFEGPQAVTADGYLDDAVAETTAAEPEAAPEPVSELAPSSAGSEQSPAVGAASDDTEDAVAEADDATDEAVDVEKEKGTDDVPDADAEVTEDAQAVAETNGAGGATDDALKAAVGAEAGDDAVAAAAAVNGRRATASA